ncbi:MAG: hypothetical protein O6952_07160, partial [Planctomycetota bacterium]|nr:hypothetical protein [Planctomycetota bacterium]
MMGTIKLSWITLICIATLLASPQDYPRLAPYSAVRWKESTPEVKVDGSWYELIALNGLPCEKIVSFCKETYGAKWQQRFGEDLVQTLTEMGHEPEETVDLKVRHLEKDEVSLLNDVAMTKENRLAVRDARKTKRKKGPSRAEPAAVLIPGEGARADLDELRHRIASQYSYASWRGAGYKTALEEVKSGLGDSIPLNELQIRIQKFLAMFGDGHSRIAGFPGRVLPRGYAPFLFGEAEGRLFVFQEDRSDFVDPEHPYLRSMDGLDVESWLRAAREIVAQGSPQWVRRQSVRNLRYVIYLRQALGLKQSRAIRMVLESEDGKRTRPREVRIATISRPAYGPWPRMNNQVLPGEIGYLRIERMESDSKVLDALRRSMRRFEGTRGL